ncbi:Hsp70 family protein [Dactylosporangium sp. NPDC048998]|uniref:Hsp70 family protein n=1 Tax=Dactylosporangium sp. NPDC048998 TaxID=3363976 RepID=UPI0037188C91
MSPAPGGYVVGIDLGTSNTVAVIRSPDGRRRPVLFDGAPLMPSSVFLQDNGQLAVGRDAQRLAQLDPGRYEPNPKRRIDEPAVLLGTAEVPTVHMLAAVLRAVAVGVSEITRFPPPVVLTYPASWGQTRRRTLYDAAIAAGWPQVSMIPEPVAAARYFISALNHPLPGGSAMVVYDFGGGTIDIAVVRNEPQGFTVIGSGGLEDVGGLDLDAALVELLGDVLRAAEPDVWRRLQDPRTSQDRRDRRLFWEDIRGAKEMLSRTTVAPVTVPGVEAALHLTREEVERKIGPMIARTVAETARVVRGSGLQASQLAGILLVGGSSRVPLVARMLHRELEVAPTVLEQPELPVAEGAVVHPAELTADGRFGVATGSASVSAPPARPGPRPPVLTGPPPAQTYGTEAIPVSSVPVSGMPGSGMPVSGIPMSGPPVSAPAAPISGVPMSSVPSSATPVSPGVGVAAAPVSPATSGAAFATASAPAPAPAEAPERPDPEPPTGRGRKRAAIIAGVAAVVLLSVGTVFALKAYDGRDSGGQNAAPPSPIGSWTKLPDLPGGALEGAGAAVADGKLYVIGGLAAEDPRPLLDAVHVFDIARGSWSDGPKLPVPTSHMTVVRDPDDAIWIIGGLTKSGATDKVWKLPPGAIQWQEGPGLPEPRNSGAGLYDGESIVFAGGTKPGGEADDTVWALHDKWEKLGILSERREKLTAATDNAGTVWFIGGVRQKAGNIPKDTIDVMVHQKMVISPGLKLDHPREGASAVTITGIGLCVLGGNEGGDKFYDWWCQDSSKTPLLPKQQMPRAGMAVTAYQGTIYAVGGYNGPAKLNGTVTAEAFKYTG